jgi:hypothetical protein
MDQYGKNNPNYKHGLWNHPLYNHWNAMRNRCLSVNNKQYHNYGGRGIKICDRWINSIENFIEDMQDTYKPGLTLERKDNDGNYEPNNCKWATHEEQSENTSTNINITINDETKPLKYWCKKYKIPYLTVYCRIRKGIKPEIALTMDHSGRGNRTNHPYKYPRIIKGKDLFS